MTEPPSDAGHLAHQPIRAPRRRRRHTHDDLAEGLRIRAGDRERGVDPCGRGRATGHCRRPQGSFAL